MPGMQLTRPSLLVGFQHHGPQVPALQQGRPLASEQECCSLSSNIAASVVSPVACRAAVLESAEASTPSTSYSGPEPTHADSSLPHYDPASGQVDLVVAGAGPSGLAVAERVSRAGQPLALLKQLKLPASRHSF